MTPPATILIVDDEPFNVDYLEQELEDLGYATLSAPNGPTALDIIREQKPDLVLLDIMMPGMDGFQVLEILKGDDDLRHIPVIIISAMSDMDSTVRGVEMGAEDYLPKPFEPVLLEARLKSSLERKALRDAEQLYTRYLAEELDVGRRIQAGFLPREIPAVEGWEIAAYFEPAREVAGDFYDVFWVESAGRLALVLGDVCDKGVGAALYMTLFRSLLRAGADLETHVRRPHQSPAAANHLLEIVTLTNNYIADVHGDSNMFATLFFGMLDPVTGSLAYINAGQEPALVLGGESILYLAKSGPVVGLFPDMTFTVEEIIMEPGMRLAVISDGMTDAENPMGEMLGREQVFRTLEETAEQSVHQQLESMIQHVLTFADDAPQSDDLSLLIAGRM